MAEAWYSWFFYLYQKAKLDLILLSLLKVNCLLKDSKIDNLLSKLKKESF